MVLGTAYNQAAFIGPLPAPNNTGVCFSLSLHWLANNCEDVFIQSVATAGLPAYGAGSNNRINLVQNAANWMAAGHIGLPMLVGVAQTNYPNLLNVAPVGVGPSPLTFGNLAQDFAAAPWPANLIWLQNPAVGGRGHVLAYHTVRGRFFDANNGVYNAEIDLHTEMASFIMHHYGPPVFTHFQVFSMQGL